MNISTERLKELQIEFLSRIRDESDKTNIDRLNNAFSLYATIAQYRNSLEIDVYEILAKADLVLAGHAYEVSEWCKTQCIPESTLKELKELEKYNVIKQKYAVVDLTLSDVYKTLSKQNTGKSIAEAAKTRYKAVIERIKANVYDQYVRERNKRNEDGSLNRFLSGDELEHCDMMADEITRLDPIVRSMNESNNNFTRIHDTMSERGIDMKYKFEKLKEEVCNKARCTPESFDKLWTAVVAEQNHRLETEVELTGTDDNPTTLYGGVTELYNVDRINEIIMKNGYLLEFIPEDKDDLSKPIYVSDIVKVIDAIDQQDIARSYGNQYLKMSGFDDIWEKYNQMNIVNEVQAINKIQGNDLNYGLNSKAKIKMTNEEINKTNKEMEFSMVKTKDKRGWTYIPGITKLNNKAEPEETFKTETVQIQTTAPKIEDLKPKKKTTSIADLI